MKDEFKTKCSSECTKHAKKYNREKSSRPRAEDIFASGPVDAFDNPMPKPKFDPFAAAASSGGDPTAKMSPPTVNPPPTPKDPFSRWAHEFQFSVFMCLL